MQRTLILGLLVGVNLALAGLLVWGVRARSAAKTVPAPADDNPPISEVAVNTRATQSDNTKRRTTASSNSAPSTPFTQMYSQNPAAFATNLRGIGCPEETVKDILVAEISRRYKAQEEALRPKPADHVPFTWSANPSERKLFQRRQQAAALAREKAAALREALGYEAPVETPVYAMTVGEQRFQDSLEDLPPEKNYAALRAREEYWARVQALQERTKGFWQSEDVAELEQLKAEHRLLFQNIQGNP